MKKIKIDGIDQAKAQYGVKITIQSGNEKYSFFDTKKDKTKTRAFEQFKRYGFSIGDVIEAEVKEEQRKFTNDKGKEVSYTDRRIIYFNEVEGLPVFEKGTETVNIDSEIKSEDLPF